MKRIPSSEITPEHVYWERRRFMTGAAKLAAGAVLLSACGGRRMPETPEATPAPKGGDGVSDTPVPASTAAPTPTAAPIQSGGSTDELGNVLTPYEAVTGYNNFYEFTTSKERVAGLASHFVTSPWRLEVGGLVNKTRVFDLDDLRAFEVEERIYRMRCVEAWSMVIPWVGFPLARLLSEVEPTSQARYVRFQTAMDEKSMPGLFGRFPWPYVEGLRLDEAMHDLTLLATGVYGRDLPPQNGAPVRLVVPWKYGFKSLKSIVKIDLVEEMPTSFWMESGPAEYGFWANVNPEVPHP
ncbi:MAG: protein-methionine-sulfoxide reductase catalytic subunit MsrP, partial [Anaerolineae bacterium]|nr:protein-methionine-sulfoxide reductase catalytic subunit MsrP [Anaerolineae bacterium]